MKTHRNIRKLFETTVEAEHSIEHTPAIRSPFCIFDRVTFVRRPYFGLKGLGLVLIAIRRGFELYECLLVFFIFLIARYCIFRHFPALFEV